MIKKLTNNLFKKVSRKNILITIILLSFFLFINDILIKALNIMEKNEITSLVVINHDKTVAGLLTLNELLRNGIE